MVVLDEPPTLAAHADITELFEEVLALSINHTNVCTLLPLVRYLEMASRVTKTASEQEVDFLYAVQSVWRIPEVGSMRQSRRDSRTLEITNVIVS